MSRSRYTLWRLLSTIPVLFVIVTLAFFIIRAAPGGPFDRDLILPPNIEANIQTKYRLHEPLWRQYGHYLAMLLRGDLGPSFRYADHSVAEVIGNSFPVSLRLGVMSLIFAMLVGLAAGSIAGLRQGQWPDHLVKSLVLFGVSVPNVVLGPLLILVFALWLGWLPVAGWGSWREVILPTVTLGMVYVAHIARMTRSGVLEVLRQDFIVTARAKGLSEWSIWWRHILRGALSPVVSMLGPTFAAVLSGSIVVEHIFQIPGLAQHFIHAAVNRDYPLVLGAVLFYALLLIVLNLLVDLLYTYLDPRVTYA